MLSYSPMTKHDIKAVIFDCDGTLVSSEIIHYGSWRHALQRHGFELTKEKYIHSFIGHCDILLSKIYSDLLGVNCSETLLKDRNDFFSGHQLPSSPITSTVNFLKHLIEEKKPKGLKLGLASGARKEDIAHNLNYLGVAHCFDSVLSGADDLTEYNDPQGTNKPKPYIYEKSARMLGLKPSQCIAIEDSSAGISAAVAAGCIAIAIPNEFTQYQDLSHAHLKMSSLEGLSLDDLLKKIAL